MDGKQGIQEVNSNAELLHTHAQKKYTFKNKNLALNRNSINIQIKLHLAYSSVICLGLILCHRFSNH